MNRDALGPTSDPALLSTQASGNMPGVPPADLLHGLALRPPAVLWDGARYRGSVLQAVQLDHARTLAGVVATVRRAHYAGVVAVSPIYARQAAAALAPVWQAPDNLASTPHDEDEAGSPRYQLRLASASSVAGARVTAWTLNGHASVWLPACAQGVQAQIRRDLGALLHLPETAIRLFAEDAHVDGQSAAHPLDLMDAAADAALLSQAAGRPVCVPCPVGMADELSLRVQTARPAMDAAHDVNLDSMLDVVAPAFDAKTTLASDAPWAVRPSLARLLSEPAQSGPSAHATVCGGIDVTSTKRASQPLRASVDELNAAQVFAEESLWHEDALAKGEDPVAWRLQHLPEGRGRELAGQVVDRAGEPTDAEAPAVAGALHGTGFATAQVQCVDEEGASRMVWAAWVADVSVEPGTGRVDVTRVVAGHDSQRLQSAQAASVHARIEQQTPWLLDNARRLLAAPSAFDEWSSPSFSDEGLALRPHEADSAMQLGDSSVGELSQGRLAVDGVVTLPAAAAIANAIHNATGVRLRQAPFDTESLRQALQAPRRATTRGRLARAGAWLAAGMASVAGVAGMAVALWPFKPALPLTAGPDVSLYSMRAIERGRLVAAAGDCVACHTAPGGQPNAGGLALDTPFGTIYTTNITPDNDTGIGRWSYTAFERAMRQGVHQDGRQLYPAFPYTAYAKLSDADMQALYGYLMSQPSVKAEPPKTQLAFPFNMRPLLAGWNALFHDATPFTPDPTRSAQWLRGAYLVEGVGHCAACHSPRNSLGAEKKGVHYLAGGEAEGWTAPALNQLASGPRAWSGDELFQYLRTGYSPSHGVAAGPMAPVIHGLSELPDSDVKAITTYLLDLPTPASPRPEPVVAAAAAAPAANMQAASDSATLHSLQGRRANGERIYQNACAMCHDTAAGPTLFGARPLLSANTNLYADTPDNLIQVILNGIQEPADDALGYMPAFKDSLNDTQVADLVGYLRERFAPDKQAWPDTTATIKRLRDSAQLD